MTTRIDDAELDLTALAVDRGSQGIAPRPRWISRYVVPAVLALGFLIVLGWAARDRYLPRIPVTVMPVHVSLSEMQSAGTPLFTAAGWIEPRPTPIRVTALAPGVIEELLVVEDQPVSAGDPIARLVDDDAQLSVQQADATCRLRAAEVDLAKAQLLAAQTDVEQPAHLELPLAEAEADLAAIETELSNLPNAKRRAEARLRLARVDLESKQQARDSLPGIVIERAQSEFDSAQAEVDELTQRQPVLESQRAALVRRRAAAAKRLELRTDEREALGVAEASLASAEAKLAEAKVALEEAELRLSRMTVAAPVDGRVLDLVVAPGTQLMFGMVAAAGHDAGTVVNLYQPEQLQVRVDVRFEDLPRVGRDQPVLVESPAVAEPLTGRVLFLTGVANIQKNTLEVKVSIDAPPEVFKPEMLVDVTFLAPEKSTADETSNDFQIFIPASLVETEGDASYVWVADRAAGVARRQRVTLSSRSGDLVHVSEGLNEGSDVIVGGRRAPVDGARIEISESTDLGD